MRIKKPKSEILEGDLTPMIDMTFQLIAFFMVLITACGNKGALTLPENNPTNNNIEQSTDDALE